MFKIMTSPSPTLYFICGKIAAGKTTLSNKLKNQPNTIVISEDKWLSALFSDEMKTVSDYVRHSKKLKSVMKPHIVNLLKAGTSVILDFPANRIVDRAWMRQIFEEAEVLHELHYLDVPDDICKQRLLKRNEQGQHAFEATEAQFELITKHFEPPTQDEDFNIILLNIIE